MGTSVNKAIIVGRLGKDPEVRYLQSGVPVARFSVATDQSWNDEKGEKQTKTEWHNVVAWRKLADICGQYLKKGKLVYIDGRIESRQYEKDGVTRYITEIVADNMVMLSGANEGTQAKAAAAPIPQVAPPASLSTIDQEDDDQIPF